MKFCSDCGTQISENAISCPKCGNVIKTISNKNKIVAILLCGFLGGIGLHKFYLNKNTAGLLYLIFCWTGIPFLLSIVDFFSLLSMNEKKFNEYVN